MQINHAEKTNNCNTARKSTVLETNVQIWRKQKQKPINENNTQKSFSGSTSGKYKKRSVDVFYCTEF
jgi:hypothetical protein